VGPEASAEDRRATINRRFDETFGTFDSRVRETQEAIARERAGRAGSQAGGPEAGSGGDGSGGDEAGSAPRARDGMESARAGGTGREGDGQGQDDRDAAGRDGAGTATEAGTQRDGNTGGGAGGGSRGRGAGGAPADVPDGSDDDVVARQIREAAMKETDPELREKLWEEYRRYKKGQ
jgi:hypothetical protein